MIRTPRPARLAILVAVLALAAGAAAARARSVVAPRPSYGGTEQAYSVQLHIHGPLSEHNGSIEWHVQKARDAGVDVLWWTDHDWRLDTGHYTQRYDFENCVWDAAQQRFVEPDRRYEERWWEVRMAALSHQKSIVDTVAHEGTKSLRMEVRDLSGTSLFQVLDLAQTGSRQQNRYSFATDYRARFALKPEQFDPTRDKFVFHITLSERTASWPKLRYVVGTLDEENADAIPLAHVPGSWNVYDLDVIGDTRARLAGWGPDSIRAQDNSAYEVRAILMTRNGGTAVVFLDEIRYFSDPTRSGLALMDWQHEAAAYYELQVPEVRHMVGSEISLFKAQPHLNAYTPGPMLVDYTGHVWSDSLYYAVEQVHAQGGLVSYNHPWGIGIYGNLSETPEQKAARILWMKRGLLSNRVLGCDLLEVGYRWRHGINLAGHLDLWDCLTANALVKTGLGITDSHGSTPFYGWAPWQPIATYENNFVTWLWATGISEIEFLKSLAAGRAYFGDPYRWQGEMDFATLDGFPMGRVVLTDKAAESVVVRITNVPEAVDVRLKQGEIREGSPTPYTTVSWLRDESLGGAVAGGVFTDTVQVDVTLPSFLRLEVRNGTQEWAFSNPIAFVRQVPADGVDAPRVAASLDAIRIRGAEDLVLRDAGYDAVAAELTLRLDEDAPGLGRMELETSAFGPPTLVTGVGSWTYAAGLLSLDGFGGGASTAVVSWAPQVGTPAALHGTPTEIALSPGRPNPFGRGVTADFALPDPGSALVEVLDVGGRRVRVLRDEWTPAGRHRVAWDGTDHYGRPVADGVYFLRLRALGTVLTTKAVKIR